jgi:predicted nucleic acid-binding protein
MKYLVDANVVSEPTKPNPNARVAEWLCEHERDLAVDPAIIGELRFGILILPRERRGPRSSTGSTRARGISTVCHGTRIRA